MFYSLFPFFIFLLCFCISCSSFNLGGKGNWREIAQSVKQNQIEKDDLIPDLPVRKFVFKNGLRLLVVENDRLPIYSYYTFFDVGGRYESRKEKTTGATHFLEHMLFKTEKKYGDEIDGEKEDFDDYITNRGGDTNAYTSFDNTVYYEKLPVGTLETVVEMEADRLGNLVLDPELFEKERQVVLEERKMRYENSPNGHLFLKMMQTFFKGTPYGGSVIGDKSDVTNLSREVMFDFFKKFYTPDNAIIVVVGDVSADRVVSLIDKKYGSFAPSSEKIKRFKQRMNDSDRFIIRPYSRRSKRWIKLNNSSPTPLFMKVFPGGKNGTRKSHVIDLITTMLGDGDSSYLQQKYVKGKKPMFSNLSFWHYSLLHNGILAIDGELLKRTSLAQAKRSLSKTVKNMCSVAITPRSLQRAKNMYLNGFYRKLETNNSLAHFIGRYEFFMKDYSAYKDSIQMYQSITVKEAKNTCRKIFRKDRSLFFSAWNKHKRTK